MVFGQRTRGVSRAKIPKLTTIMEGRVMGNEDIKLDNESQFCKVELRSPDPRMGLALLKWSRT